jgi:hypothetical protein
MKASTAIEQEIKRTDTLISQAEGWLNMSRVAELEGYKKGLVFGLDQIKKGEIIE